LRMQINPHFLFNTLNAISTLVHTDPEAADDMITDLSELFRGSLESSDEQEIPLARELEFLQRYLSIEQRRFGNHLQIEQSVEPEILSALVPTFILQPLVENAVRHGVESQANVGKIAIRGKREGDSIRLSVSDNGKKPVVLSESNERSVRQGIGLTNARARLRQLYGNDQSLSIRQGDLGGWMIDIKLPYKFGSAEKVNL
jgi:two-component system LytT family sensor kinase